VTLQQNVGARQETRPQAAAPASNAGAETLPASAEDRIADFRRRVAAPSADAASSRREPPPEPARRPGAPTAAAPEPARRPATATPRAPSKPLTRFGRIRAQIDALKVGDVCPEERAAIVKAIAAIDAEGDRETLLIPLAKASKINRAILRKEVAESFAASLPAGAVAGGDSEIVQVEGLPVLLHSGEAPDQIHARKFMVGVMNQRNKTEGAPIFTLNPGGALMRLRREQGRASFDFVSARELPGLLGRECSFAHHPESGRQPKRTLPRADLCQALFSSFEPGELPEQPTIRRAPTMGRDGLPLATDGWFGDVLVDLNGLQVPAIPDTPTADDVKAARALIVGDLLGDFPFFDRERDDGEPDGKASLANAVGALLTPFVRDLFEGLTPLFLYTKAASGDGATYLAGVSPLLYDGVATAPTKYTSDEDEMQKNMVAGIRGERSHFLFDNVTQLISNVLKQNVTSEYIGGRVLGQSQEVSATNIFIWQATGINVRPDAEMQRRTCYVNLNSRLADNSQRTFKHASLHTWTLEKRGELIAALLTLARAWIVAGRKRGAATLLGFDGWARIVGGILEHAEITGFMTNRPTMRDDREGAEIKDFIADWWSRWGAQPVAEKDAFAWASDTESPLVQGFDAATRRKGFVAELDRIKDRVFAVGEARDLERRFAQDDSGEWALLEIKRKLAASGEG
jgi:hypothetical protein